MGQHVGARLVVQCHTAFFGSQFSGRAGELFYADDPLVVAYPQYFGAPKVRGSSVESPVIVEQATAAPGEKRGK